MINRRVRSIAPNLLTLANLFSGFTAIIYTTQGDFHSAALFIFLGAIFDMLDGMAARILHTASDFGVELDSLCDAVTFGLAPSFLLYFSYFYQFGDTGILISSLPAIAGVVRLARFNSQLTSLEDKKYFTGLPIPAGALTLISYSYFYDMDLLKSSEFRFYFTLAITIFVALIMVSRIKYENLPRPSLNSMKSNPILFAFVILSIILGIVTVGFSIFPSMLIFIVVGLVRYVYNFINSNDFLENDDDDDLEEPNLDDPINDYVEIDSLDDV
jgi:CDP-diacylglycerol--serine O-phosphatidyltransferase